MEEGANFWSKPESLCPMRRQKKLVVVTPNFGLGISPVNN